ncbi:44352_t:CDS:1, partial [Gigaspora margarita]
TLDKNNQFIFADNRQFYCYQQAIKKGAKIINVPVRIVKEIDEKAGFNWKRENSLKIVPNKT